MRYKLTQQVDVVRYLKSEIISQDCEVIRWRFRLPNQMYEIYEVLSEDNERVKMVTYYIIIVVKILYYFNPRLLHNRPPPASVHVYLIYSY